MKKLSNVQLISVCLVTLNSIAINIIIVLNSIRLGKEIKETRGKSQMEKILDSGSIKVAIYKNYAYWVINNVIYKARLDRDGNVMNEEAEEIDVFNLSDKEVDNLLVILDSINK